MKRSSSFSLPEMPAPSRKRHLSEEERALWESVARQVKPLRKKPRLIKHASVPVTEPPAGKLSASPRPIASVQPPKPSKPATPPLAPLGRREKSRLSRGRSEIDAFSSTLEKSSCSRVMSHGLARVGTGRLS